MSLLLNQGAGTFGAALSEPVGMLPLSVDLADLDGDGDLDLAVVATDARVGPAVQVLGNLSSQAGEPVFGQPVAFSVEAEPNFVASGDFDGDGVSDLVTVNDDEGASGGSVTVLLNCLRPEGCVADVNGDGGVDVSDLVGLILGWGCVDEPGCCSGDANSDGITNVTDLVELILSWGPCPVPP